jgi:hypothetical protein
MTYFEKIALDSFPKDVKSIVVQGGYVYPGRAMLIGTRFISSVSGGSLASAYWANETRKVALDTPRQPNQDSISYRAVVLRKFFEQQEPGNTSPFEYTYSMDDRTENQAPSMPSIEHNHFIRAMGRNYLASAIVGLFDTSSSRSQSIRSAFERYAIPSYGPPKPGTSDPQPTRMSDLYQYEFEGVLPYSIFNATLTNSGERFAISNLSSEWFASLNTFGPEMEGEVPRPDPERRFDCRAGYVLLSHALDSDWNPQLTTATWISSDFPYGFPVNRMRCNFGRAGMDVMGSLDGGLSDNLGLNTTMSIIRALAKDDLTKRYAKDALTRFFVFDVDTSEMMIDPDPPSELSYHYQEADDTVERAKQVAEQTSWALYLRELGQLFSQNVTPDLLPTSTESSYRSSDQQAVQSKSRVGFFTKNRWAWYRVRAGELRTEHVSTSWHLSGAERRTLYRIALGREMKSALVHACRRYLILAGRSRPNVKS